jgi:threonine dehydrogenase-like Zn-dependent dehydrogenase
VSSASSSVCNHMVALVFGRTCTGDARRYVKRTPDFICLSGERKSHSACLQGGIWGFGHEGKQAAEAIRARFADATLVVVPPEVEGDETLLKALLPLTDVMAAGHHAAVSANVQAGARVAVIGDGAVGLCAEPTIALGHQSEQMALTSTGTSLRHPVL